MWKGYTASVNTCQNMVLEHNIVELP